MCVCVISLCVFGLWPMLYYTWSSLFRPRRDGLCLEWSAWVACDFPCLWLVWCIKTGKRLAHCSGFHWSGGIIRCLVGQHYLKWLFLAAANYRWYWDRCFFWCQLCWLIWGQHYCKPNRLLLCQAEARGSLLIVLQMLSVTAGDSGTCPKKNNHRKIV